MDCGVFMFYIWFYSNGDPCKMFYCKMTGNVYMRKSFTNNFVAKEILNFTVTSQELKLFKN